MITACLRSEKHLPLTDRGGGSIWRSYKVVAVPQLLLPSDFIGEAESTAKSACQMFGKTTIRASESVSEQAMAFVMSNGCTVVWGMDLKWKFS